MLGPHWWWTFTLIDHHAPNDFNRGDMIDIEGVDEGEPFELTFMHYGRPSGSYRGTD